MKSKLSRRQFIRGACATACAACLPAMPVSALGVDAMETALHWEAVEAGKVHCLLCYHGCILDNGASGICRVRRNVEGSLRTLVWNNPCVLASDPVEKAPLHHVLPGSKFLALGSAGCNLTCLYCQNWQVAQQTPDLTENFDLTPEKAAQMASTRGHNGIMLTFNDPVVVIEYAGKVLEAAKAAGLLTSIVTGGAISPVPRKEFCRNCDAVTFGLKGFTQDFYTRVVGGKLEETLKSLEGFRKDARWLEVTTLIVPTMNDDEKTMREQAKWLKENIGAEVPFHISRFFPEYKLRNLPTTPVPVLARLRDAALEEGLKYVYLSNVSPHDGNHTYCHGCGKLLIKRIGFKTVENLLTVGKCPTCGVQIPGIW